MEFEKKAVIFDLDGAICFDEKINDRLWGVSRMASLDIILEQVAEKIGIVPADCAVLEYAKSGIEAAKADGKTTLALFDDTKGCG